MIQEAAFLACEGETPRHFFRILCSKVWTCLKEGVVEEQQQQRDWVMQKEGLVCVVMRKEKI